MGLWHGIYGRIVQSSGSDFWSNLNGDRYATFMDEAGTIVNLRLSEVKVIPASLHHLYI